MSRFACLSIQPKWTNRPFLLWLCCLTLLMGCSSGQGYVENGTDEVNTEQNSVGYQSEPSEKPVDGPPTATVYNRMEKNVIVRDLVSSFYLERLPGFLESQEYEKYLERDDEKIQQFRRSLPYHSDSQPIVYYDFKLMDTKRRIVGESPAEVYYNRAFCSSLFYMEIPNDWYAGTNGACPFIFCHESDTDPRGEYKTGQQKTYRDVFPGKDLFNKQASDEVAEFILAGGINEVLEDALGHPLTDEYELTQDEPGVCTFRVKKNGIPVADVCVWEYIGQVVVMNNEVQVKTPVSNDHGRVYVFQEWADEDFSTREAISEYMESGKAERLLEPILGDGGGPWSGIEYSTDYHDFMCFEGKYEKRRVTIYIPITSNNSKNWLILFETSAGTDVAENAYNLQQHMMESFILQPYYYEVKKGDTLYAISDKYTGNPDNYMEIAAFKFNRVGTHPMDPDLIYPGQKIGIPLNLLFNRTYY